MLSATRVVNMALKYLQLFASQLNNTEISVIFWTVLFLAWALTLKSVREQIPNLLRSFLQPVVGGMFLLLGLWTCFLVVVLNRAGYWQISMLKDTVWWFFGSATVLLMKLASSKETSDYFVRAMRDTLTVAVVVKFALGIFVVSLPWAMISVPLATILSCLVIIAEKNPDHLAVRKLANFLLFTMSAALVWVSLKSLIEKWNTVDLAAKGEDFLLPVALTLGIIPFVYAVALWVKYDTEFRRLEVFLENTSLSIHKVKWLTFLTCRFSLPGLEALDGDYHVKLQRLDNASKVPALICQYTRPDPAFVVIPSEIEVLSVRLVPHQMPKGPTRRRLQVDWKNNGKVPVDALFANISQFDKNGLELKPSTKDWGIFYAGSDPIEPGEIYTESGDEGYILLPWEGTPVTAKVEVTKVRSVKPLL